MSDSIDSLRTSFNSWPSLTSIEKIALLAKTERKIEKSSAEKVAEFCLHVLSQISLEYECNQNPSLNEPVRKIALNVQSKSTSIFFHNSTESESGYVGFLVNKKNPYLLLGSAPIQSSLAISASRVFFKDLGQSCIQLDPSISQETCVNVLMLFNMSQDHQSLALKKLTGKELKGIKKAAECFKLRDPLNEEIEKQFALYLNIKKKKQFIKEVEFKDEKKLIAGINKVNSYNDSPVNAKTVLNLIRDHYSNENEKPLSEEAIEMFHWYLSIIKESVFISSAKETQRILEAIESVLSLKPDNESLRNDLVEIILAVPLKRREKFTENLLSKKYYISSTDPLYFYMLEEVKRTGRGWESVYFLLVYEGADFTFQFLNRLGDIHPKSILPFAKSLISWAGQYDLGNEAELLLFQYALSIQPDHVFVTDLTEYMRSVILPFKLDINSDYPVIEKFFEKIKHLPEAYYFLYSLCEYALKKNEFNLAIQFAEWDRRISVPCPPMLPPINSLFFSADLPTPEKIADLFIKRKLNISEVMYSPISLLARSDWLVSSSKIDLTVIQKTFLSLALRLCQEKNYPKVVDLVASLEESGECSILFPLLANYSDFDSVHYEELFTLMLETHSTRQLVDYIQASTNFNLFHKKVIENLFNLLQTHSRFVNAEESTPIEVANFLITQQSQVFGINEEIKRLNYLTRAKYLPDCSAGELCLIQKSLILVAERLWNNKSYEMVASFVECFEGKKYSILFPFLVKIFPATEVENYNKLFALALNYYSLEAIVRYLRESMPFTPFHIELMNRIKANAFLRKKHF